eukprot:2729129-Alexandrium_andersonii.AAC.1
MSASLVGSEMCIRDRPCTGLLELGSIAKQLSPSPFGAAQPLVSRPITKCLLYTSDAADDM